METEFGCAGDGNCDQCIGRSTPMLTRHHRWWPKNEYTTDLEKKFRNHPAHIDLMAWCEHRRLHFEQKPPQKPSINHMVAFLMRYERNKKDV